MVFLIKNRGLWCALIQENGKIAADDLPTKMSHSTEQKSSNESAAQSDFYEVEQILDSKETASGAEYLIKWKNYPNPRDYTWEPRHHLHEVMYLVEEFNKKRQERKKLQTRAGKGARKIKDQMEEPHSQADSLSSQDRSTKKRPRPKKTLYLPKVVKTNAQQEMPVPERKHQTTNTHKKPRQRANHQITQYLVAQNVVNLQENTVELPQNDHQKKHWFSSDSYKLQSIFRHIIQNDRIVYLCNVVTKNGDLSSIVKLSDQEVANFNLELQKKYILTLLFESLKQRDKMDSIEYRQFDRYWKTQ